MAERPPGPGLSSSQQSSVGGEAGGPEASGDLAQGPEGDRTSEQGTHGAGVVSELLLEGTVWAGL